ncbi:hypothetical protein E4T42_02009 [Aureobasidium subglaciale]|nr:hypothetical protein E4T42_02009 [Aureobasidium subglaciale]
MSEDTRQLVLRIQSEDLATLWASSENQAEVDATLRVYRRQLKLLDAHLENPRHHVLISDGSDAANSNGLLPIDDPNACLLTVDGDVHQQGVVYPRHDTPSRFASAASSPLLVSATTARPPPKLEGPPRVRLPPSSSRTASQSSIKPVVPLSRRSDVPSAPAAMRGVKLNPFVQSPPKRSADHIATPNTSPFKKRANAIVKREVMDEPTLPSRNETIRDKLQKLNCSISSRLQTPDLSKVVHTSPNKIFGVPSQQSSKAQSRPFHSASRIQIPTGPKILLPSTWRTQDSEPSHSGPSLGARPSTRSPIGLNQAIPSRSPFSSFAESATTPIPVTSSAFRFGAPSEVAASATAKHYGRDTGCEIPSKSTSSQADKSPRPKPTVTKTPSSLEGPHQECTVCCRVEPTSKIYVSPCGHRYCHKCVSHRFESALRDETLWPPRCCRQNWPDPPVFLDILESEICTRAFSRMVEARIPIRERLYCAGCSAWICNRNSVANVRCNNCGTSTCASCKAVKHDGACTIDTTDLVVLRELASIEGWQECSQCHRFIELTDGCNHVQCRCGYELCFQCGQEWNKFKGCSCELFDADWLQKREEERGYARIWKVRCNHATTDPVRNVSDENCDKCGELTVDFFYECKECLDRYCRECAWYRL